MTTTPIAVIDALVLPGPSLFGGGVPAGELLDSLDRLGVEGAVLAPPRDPDYSARAANDRIASIVREAPERRRQLARVDPNHRDAIVEIARCAEELGAAGYYLSPREECFQIDGHHVAAALEAIAGTGLPLVIEAGVPWVSEPLQILAVSERHPELDIVMTNGGQFNISGLGQADAFEALDRSARIRILTSGVYRQDFIEASIRRFGADRVLFGSAAPMFDPRYELLRVLGADCSDAERATVAGLAARALFW
jgi:predicted TIM-barrel fold metal-dependent hydrolase